MLKFKLAANRDCYGRVLISSAIIMKNEQFVNILPDTKFDITTIDNEGKTPFIHACIVNVMQWMTKLFELIPFSNANIVDNFNGSALTYAAENNQRDFCDYLFCCGIKVDGIRSDSNGIIEYYLNLLHRYSYAQSKALENYNDAKDAYYEVKADASECDRRKEELEREIRNINSEIDSYNADEQRTMTHQISLESKLSDCKRAISKYNKMAERIQRDLDHATDVMNYYEARYKAICDATRSDILHNIDRIEDLSCRDRKIGEREFYIDWDKIGAIALGILLLLI